MGGFARINCCFAYGNGQKLYMLANLDLLKVAKVVATSGYVQNAARGRGRGQRRVQGHGTLPARPRSSAIPDSTRKSGYGRGRRCCGDVVWC